MKFKTSLWILTFSLFSSVGAFAQDATFSETAFKCDKITMTDPADPTDSGFASIEVMTNDEYVSGNQNAALLMSMGCPDCTEISSVISVGKLTVNSSGNEGSFLVSTSHARYSIEVRRGRNASHVKLEMADENGQWSSLYDGAANCGFYQYESIGAHN